MHLFKSKGTILLFLSCFYLVNTNGQTCTWAKTLNPNSNCSYVATDALGNIYITGTFGGTAVPFGGFTLTSYGSQNIFLAKLDGSGNVLWVHSGEGNGNDWSYAVSVDRFGNALITGGFSSSQLILGTYTLTNQGNDDYYLAKYDSDGNVLWAKSAGSPNLDGGFSVSSDSFGDVYVVGYSDGPNITIGTYTLTSPSQIMIFAKYDALNGSVIWAKTASGSAQGYGLTIDKHDNIYIGGEFGEQIISFGTHTLALSDTNYSSFFIAQYDRFGTCNWAKSGTNRYVYGLCTNSVGDVFALGNFFTPTVSIGTFTLNNLNNTGGYNNFLVRYDSSGNVIWARSFGSTTDGLSYAVASDASNLYVIGNVWHSSPVVVGNYTVSPPPSIPPYQNVTNPMLFARFDFSGNAVFAKIYNTGGGSGDDQSWLCTDKNKNVYLAGGFSTNPMVIDSYSLTSPTCCGSYIAKFYFDDVGIKENSTNRGGSTLYPNPNNGEFTIKFSETKKIGKFEIIIFDVTGRLIFEEQKTAGSSNEFHLENNLQNGMYLVKVKFDDGSTDIHHLIISREEK